MAHDLAMIGGKHAMFVVGNLEDAWHKLGQRCDSAVNWEQAMSLAKLDWGVVKTQNYARNPQGHVIPVSSYSIFRDNDGAELASNVGEGFTVAVRLVQNLNLKGASSTTVPASSTGSFFDWKRLESILRLLNGSVSQLYSVHSIFNPTLTRYLPVSK